MATKNNKNKNYHDEQNRKNVIKLRAVLDTLPKFCRTYFRGIEEYTSSRTKLAYAYDLRVFFEFMHEQNSIYSKMEIVDYPISLLDEITRMDIEEYLEYITLYEKNGKEITNDERGKSRKLASLRSFYNYFFENELIEKNPAALVPLPKRHQKEIVSIFSEENYIKELDDKTDLEKLLEEIKKWKPKKYISNTKNFINNLKREIDC